MARNISVERLASTKNATLKLTPFRVSDFVPMDSSRAALASSLMYRSDKLVVFKVYHNRLHPPADMRRGAEHHVVHTMKESRSDFRVNRETPGFQLIVKSADVSDELGIGVADCESFRGRGRCNVQSGVPSKYDTGKKRACSMIQGRNPKDPDSFRATSSGAFSTFLCTLEK